MRSRLVTRAHWSTTASPSSASASSIARTGRTGFYEIYRAHDFHFLAYAAMFAGREQEAIDAARALLADDARFRRTDLELVIAS